MTIIFILQQASSGLTTPGDYVKELQRVEVTREHLLKTLQSVRVSLTGRPIRSVVFLGITKKYKSKFYLR